MGLKCIFIAQFYGQLKEKKLTDNFSSLGAMEGGKKYQSVTHVSTGIFQVLFKNIVCSFSHQKVMGYFRFFFHIPDFFSRPVPYPINKK